MRLFSSPASPPLAWCELHFGRELDRDAVHSLLTTVVADRRLDTVVFEVANVGGSLTFRVGASNIGRITKLLATLLPTVATHTAVRKLSPHVEAHNLQLRTRRRAVDGSDPSSSSARLLGALAANNGSIHQLVIGARLAPVVVPSRLDEIPGESWPRRIAGAALVGSQRVDTEARIALVQKQAMPGAKVNVRLLSSQANRTGMYEAAVRSLQSPGLQLRLAPARIETARTAGGDRRAIPLNVDELVALLGWPYGERSYPGVDRSGATLLAPAHDAVDSDRIVGVSSFPGRDERVGLGVNDSLRHLHLIGPTGVGKSTLLLNLILQDIEAGRSVVVIDPKGDLVSDVLARIKRTPMDRIVLLDPASQSSIVGFNPLAGPARSAELVVDGVLHTMKEIYSSSWGPRTSDILHSALLTLIGTEWASIIYVPHLLSDADFRSRVLTAQPRSPHLMTFWHWFDSLSTAERAQVIAPALNKLRPFLLRTSLRTTLGQTEPAVDPATVFTQRRVLLVPLRKGEIGAEPAALIGSLVVAQLWQLAQKRTGLPESQRHPVMLYLDEFQDYLRLSTDLADVLAQARGLGVSLNLAHQHLGQLTPDVRAAVLANAQSRVAFRLGADDARILARSSKKLDDHDFTALGRYQIYADLLTVGNPGGWVSARTTPASGVMRDPRKLAKQLSKRDGLDPATVDQQIAAALNHPAPEASESGPSTIGRRPRGKR